MARKAQSAQQRVKVKDLLKQKKEITKGEQRRLRVKLATVI
jgi:hypothetical protein